jgi:hypothetical protein
MKYHGTVKQATNPTGLSRQALQNSSITSQSPSSPQGDTSLNKLHHIDPVKYCMQNYRVRETGKAAGSCLLPFWSETPPCYSFIYNITSARVCMTSSSALRNEFPILYSLHDHINGTPLSQ